MADAAVVRRGLWWRRTWVLALTAGAGLGLGQVPFSVVVIAGIAGAAAFVLCARAESVREAFRIGWFIGVGYFALTLHWIVEPFLVDIVRHGWMAPFALVLLSGGMALFWGAATALARLMGPRLLPFCFTWPAAMLMAEWLRSTILTGFPWALVGYQWVDTPARLVSAWVGPFGLTLATLALAAAAGGLAVSRGRVWVGLGAVVPAVAMAAALAERPPEPIAADRPLVRMIQPNAPQHQKWDPSFMMEFYERQLSFTAAPGLPDLVVWSESAIPWRLSNADGALIQISEAAQGAPVVLGLNRTSGEDWFNSAIVLSPEQEITALYDKHHLVPFGEYVPLAPLLRDVGLDGLAGFVGGFSPGPGADVMDLGALGRGLPLICYEAIFPRNIHAAPERPDYILHLTNDAWFGKIAGPQQHLAQARLRAAEFGLPVIRAANTGISAMIDGRGRVLGSLPLNEAGFLDARLPPALPPTIYARLGDKPVLALALLMFAIGAVLGLRKPIDRPEAGA